ncbi:class I SAM-dependent methyltransferase [Candidatus Acetothermia bacterium]|nr:class I SAM-dependent methyltransferase [Candidatus Acetothermia bacterium]MBI3644051.1 class I SAM-dependent methyltransferase [Candidatus Acetothermia bacterium]
MTDQVASFAGSIPENYDKYLGPMIFEPYAKDLAQRAAKVSGSSVLEIAAGTGVATRSLRDALPPATKIVATDLNEPMLEIAKSKFKPTEKIEFKPADAMSLPFPDQAFDTAVCQFGVMFFPDKLASFREVARILKPQGRYLFNVWDSLDYNPIPKSMHGLTTSLYRENPPGFYQTPFGFYQIDPIKEMLLSTGFQKITFSVLKCPLSSPSARDAATGLVKGNPISLQILERQTHSIEEVMSHVERELANKFGKAPVRSSMQAIVVEAQKA